MTTPRAELELKVNAGVNQFGAVTAPSAATISFVFPTTVGWAKYRLEVYGPPGWTPPGGWTVEGDVAVYTGVTAPPPDVVLPANTVIWGKWMPRLIVNDGRRNDAYEREMYDTRSGISMLSPSGLVDLGTQEEGQFGGAVRKWAAAIQTALRVIETGMVAGDVPPPGTNGNTLALVAGIPAWASLNLAGGANFITGLLPNGNQAVQTLAGDVTGNTGASVVGNITLGSDARGDTYYRNATTLARLAAGTSGKFLKTLGAGADPTWSDVDKLISAGAITITSVGDVSWNNIIDTKPIDTTSAPATIFTLATLTIPVSSARAYAARVQVRDTSGVGYYYGELRDSYQRAGGAPAREGAAPAIVGPIATGTLAACTFAFSVSGNDVILTVTTGIAASRVSATCEALK